MKVRLSALIALRIAVVLLVLGLSNADRVPWWFAALVVVRELAAGILLALRRIRRSQVPAVDRLAPAAALMLVGGLVILIGATGDSGLSTLSRVFGWPLAWWGAALSWSIVATEVWQARRLLAREPRPERP